MSLLFSVRAHCLRVRAVKPSLLLRDESAAPAGIDWTRIAALVLVTAGLCGCDRLADASLKVGPIVCAGFAVLAIVLILAGRLLVRAVAPLGAQFPPIPSARRPAPLAPGHPRDPARRRPSSRSEFLEQTGLQGTNADNEEGTETDGKGSRGRICPGRERCRTACRSGNDGVLASGATARTSSLPASIRTMARTAKPAQTISPTFNDAACQPVSWL